MSRWGFAFVALLLVAGCQKQERVGPVGDNKHLTATGQYLEPAGDLITFPGRPVDLTLSPDGKFVFAKDDDQLVVIDRATRKVIQELGITGGSSGHGICIDGSGVWVSSCKSTIMKAEATDGKWAWAKTINLPKP